MLRLRPSKYRAIALAIWFVLVLVFLALNGLRVW
jgi:hypothetical protein